MKKLTAVLLALLLALAAFPVLGEDSEPVLMSHEEYMAAPIDSEVYVLTYVQATQSWWNDQITVYAQSPDGAYFIYNMGCSEEEAAKLVPGTPIYVKGFKAEWAGEIEIADAGFLFAEEGTEPFIAEVEDVTDKLGICLCSCIKTERSFDIFVL